MKALSEKQRQAELKRKIEREKFINDCLVRSMLPFYDKALAFAKRETDETIAICERVAAELVSANGFYSTYRAPSERVERYLQ